MHKSALLSASRIVLSALLIGSVTSCAASSKGVADAGSDHATAPEEGAHPANRARTSLAAGRLQRAIAAAEQAVAADPDRADYRALLGKSYLKAGRFRSAEAALDDALSLAPRDGEAALHLALARIAAGDQEGALSVLTTHGADIVPGDLGLALALAGDGERAIPILSAAAHGPKASATARQNLALALALTGHWREAKAIASIDISPNDLDARMAQWAELAKADSGRDRVAALLKVTPADDPGQPERLALTRQAVPVAVAISSSPEPAAQAPVVPAEPKAAEIRFADRAEVVQPVAAQPNTGQGRYFVQLGAFRDADMAETAWQRITARHAAIGRLNPMGAHVSIDGRDFYRLSVGGFARDEATRMCTRIRADGGHCFVRADAGERLADWAAQPDSQLAAR